MKVGVACQSEENEVVGVVEHELVYVLWEMLVRSEEASHERFFILG